MARSMGRPGSRPELDSGTVSCRFSLSLGRAENSVTSVPSAPDPGRSVFKLVTNDTGPLSSRLPAGRLGPPDDHGTDVVQRFPDLWA